ncbi:DpnD/PcfM family protein [Bengtsoniella intestinalis]|uniref:DpnD/PcfM family protein n=1 Tax=Bengtsoniella intestinalis TaxID=3073143 RepID=UPI00391EFBA3
MQHRSTTTSTTPIIEPFCETITRRLFYISKPKGDLPMKEFDITITETLKRTVTVTAENREIS